ncbi:MAG: electron transfer flavoprotein subunit alpha/FixB family protein [Elusimicrobia bacterium]|nr:electron transfer flavoprotein subunit alpha/FixB family protein [Elusimicrobiota bacterium]
MAGILVWAEASNDGIRKAAREAAGVGVKLAEKLNAPLAAVMCADKPDLAAKLGRLGFSKVYAAAGESFSRYSSEAFSAAIAEAGDRLKADIYLLGATALGRDLAARLAARLDAGLATDVTEIQWDSSPLTVVRPVYSGKLLAVTELTAERKVISLRPNVFPAPAEQERSAEVEAISLEDVRIRAQVQKAIQAAQGALDVTEAEIIVSGGRGVGGPEGFKVVEDLARALRGAVGASRAAVDSGWIPYKHQVGQTGKVVSPVLYIACGISGAIQHFAGMGSSKFIIAINTDKEAPIMGKADFSIVGDLFKVVPILKEELGKAMKQ